MSASHSPTQPTGPGSGSDQGSDATPYVVLTGNPNCGKTTLFNALTGLRAKVGNYPGVTVERKEGKLQGAAEAITILDLPGTYSLSPQSLDEQVARDVLFHRLPEVPPPAVVVVVIDASNLQRNLYFATQVIELGYPTLVALNMVDVAEASGLRIDDQALSKALGVKVIPVVASGNFGLLLLREQITKLVRNPRTAVTPRLFCELPDAFGSEATSLSKLLESTFPETHYHAMAEALLVLSDERILKNAGARYPQSVVSAVEKARESLTSRGLDWRSVAIESRYARIAAIQEMVTTVMEVQGESVTDKLDRVFTHRIWGVIIFVLLMFLMFQGIFSFAQLPMEYLEKALDSVGEKVSASMPPGALNELIQLGVFKGVGAVIVFLPQICLLFFFIGLLEDTGYMARAAFLMDRIMSKVGLHGKSFIPMLSSFACAIPGIMATRTIESQKDRLVTILVAPLMSCSARLPVYTVLIAACIPAVKWLGFISSQAMVMLAMYLLGIVVALLMAWLFKKTLLKGPTPMLILELPPYKRPLLSVVVRNMWDRSKMFLRRAGTVILGINIILWFLANYPKSESVTKPFEERRQAVMAAAPSKEASAEVLERHAKALEDIHREEAGERLRHSFAGRAGRMIEPIIAPLGFDWKIGIGIVASFAAREVFVSTMSLVYNVGETSDDEASLHSLAEVMRAQNDAEGRSIYRPRIALTLMVFYVFALQCVSTVAVVRRETNGWKWPIFQWFYMGALAWGLAFLTYHLLPLFGLA